MGKIFWPLFSVCVCVCVLTAFHVLCLFPGHDDILLCLTEKIHSFSLYVIMFYIKFIYNIVRATIAVMKQIWLKKLGAGRGGARL
jgi:multisubunit Na+/H+ antiporter MnhE subunit